MRSAHADYFGISEPEDPSKALQNGDGAAETSAPPEGQTELVFEAPPEIAVNDSHEPIDVCCCSGCSEVHYPGDGHNHGPNDFTYTDGPGTQTYVEVLESLDPSNEDSGLVGTNDPGNGKPIWSAYQTAQHIARSGLNWTNDGDMVVTYRFADATTAGDPNWVFEQVNQAHTRSILEFFAEVTGVTFVEVTTSTNGVQDDADITFRYRDGSNGGGYWDGSNVVVSRVSWEPEMLPGTYNFRLMVHEIGHAMGLSHPGPYNGSGFNYADDADHWNDSYQYTSLSYFNESNTGGSFGNMATLGLHDILAMQIEYGTDWTTRDTDTVYGYNQTTGLNSYDLTYRNDIAFSIWDGGGTDTLDFSGSSQGTELDLREGSFSSVNGQTYNVSIAYNAVIENGVGSAHDDTITGNGVANTIWGGAGDDVISGRSADAPSSTPDPRHFTGFELNNDPLERDQYLSIADLYTMPADAITLEMMVDAVRMPSGGLIFASYAVRSNSNEFLIEGRNGGNLRIHIDGTFYDTSISTVSLIDGQPHRLSVSWDSASGALNIYVDGNLAESATFQQGAQIAPGGTLIFGQEQDVQGGSFSTTQIFSGTVGDIRVFDDVRTAGEVSANAFSQVSTSEDGLVHNWQVQAGDTTTVRDVATNTPLYDLTNLRPDLFTATQSSNPYSNTPASNVLDDDLDSFSHTRNSGNEWLEVDFSQALDITHVELVNRNGWESRLDGAVVKVLDVNGTVIHTFPAISGVGRQEALRLELPSTMTAGSIRIEHTSNFLHLAEVNVYGTPPAGTTLPARDTDLTVNGAATVRNTAPVVDLTPDNDTLHGEDGNDTISGGWGDDTLIGGRGSDTLNGGKGNDTLRGEGAIVEPPATAAIDMIRLNENYVVSGSTSYDDHELRAAAKVSLPASAITVEMMLRTENLDGAYGTIMASSTGGEWDTMDFAIRVDAFNSRLSIHVAGNEYRTSILKSAFDGTEAKRLSVSWESSSGELKIYIDGNLVETGSVSQGANLTASTNLWFGSGWWHKFDIALGDIRVWDTVRSATEVYDNAFAPVSDPANTQGLAHNWQVNPADLTSLTDATGTSPVLNTRDITASNAPSAETGDFTDLFGFDDTLNGDEGDDLLEGGRGADVIHGGSGVDTATYAASSAGVTVNLAGGLGSGGDATGDRLIQVENLIGSAHADVLRGSEQANVIRGGGARDVIITGGGDDQAFGEGGDDLLRGGTGRDVLDGGADNDTIFGEDDEDVLFGRSGDDYLDGGGANDILRGGDGNDRLEGGAGDDRLDGEDGNDVMIGGAGIDTGYGGEGNDTFRGGDNNDYAFGEAGNDRLDGDAGNDRLEGGSGVDTIYGGSGNDVLFGGTESDFLFGGDNNDTIRGDAGIDRIDGGSGDDTIFGGDDRDIILGASGADYIAGDGGDDVLRGGDQNDRLEGGTGADRLDGNNGNDVLSGEAGHDTIYGGLGDDTGYGGEGNDFAFGEAGDDRLNGDAGEDRLDGGADNDTLYGGADNDVLLGGSGNDFAFGESGDDFLRGGTGIDRLDGGADNDTLYGEDGDDTLVGGSGNDSLLGGNNNDALNGGHGADVLRGGSGTDRLIGGVGDDVLFGETGQDSYVFNSTDTGADIVVGFEAGEMIELFGFGYATVAEAALDFTQVGGDVVFSNGGVSATFRGTSLADVTANLMIDAPASPVIAAPDTDAGAPMLIAPLAEDTFDFAGLSSGTSNATASLELDSVKIFENRQPPRLQREDDLGPVIDLGFDFAIFEDDGFLL